MLTIVVSLNDGTERQVIANGDKDWSIDREGIYLIAAAVDGSRHLFPLSAINYIHIIGS